MYDIQVKKIYDLAPAGRQKSYYGRAKVLNTDNGAYLMSYNTIVMYISDAGDVVRLWDGWSATTAKHIDSFCRLNNVQSITKKEWLKMPVGLPAKITLGA